MLKNIKLFSTDNDRTTYESSASYETPYVSKVAADNSVHYNRPLRIISFTINNVSYQALEGMTWEQWVNTEYNTRGWSISDDTIVDPVGYIIADAAPNEQIQDNYNYRARISG